MRDLSPRWPRLGEGAQLRYEFWIADEQVGYMVIGARTHWIGYVHVAAERRGQGLGVRMHEIVAARHDGWLTLELACSPSERRALASLERRGWRQIYVPFDLHGRTHYYRAIGSAGVR